MKKLLFLVCFSLFILPLAGYGQNLDTKDLTEYLEKARTEWQIPGMSVAIVAKDSIIYQAGFGITNTQNPEKVTPATIFGIASNTKAFTSAALAILVDRGIIQWDDPVQKYLPWFQLYDPYVSANITIRDLLSHRSGLKTFSGDLIWYGSTYSRTEILKRAKLLNAHYGFREHFGYSNILYLAAGQIIEEATDTTWEDFISTNLLFPLEMKRSTTSIAPLKQYNNVAQPHNLIDDKNQPIPLVNWDNIAPAGGIFSSAKDMCNWLRFHLNQGKYKEKSLLAAHQFYEMRQPVTPRKTSPSAASQYPYIKWRAYGLGWNVQDYAGYQIISHSGGLDGMVSQVFMIPEKQLGFVLLTNNSNGATAWLSYEILDRLTNNQGHDWSTKGLEQYKHYLAYKKKQRESILAKRIANTNPSLPLCEYTGTYQCPIYGDIHITIKNNKLHLAFKQTALLKSKLTHWHIDTFSVQFTQMPSLPMGWVQFSLTPNGKVYGLKVDVPNPDFDFTEFDFTKQEAL